MIGGAFGGGVAQVGEPLGTFGFGGANGSVGGPDDGVVGELDVGSGAEEGVEQVDGNNRLKNASARRWLDGQRKVFDGPPRPLMGVVSSVAQIVSAGDGSDYPMREGF